MSGSILVVDDEASHRSALADVLRDEGYDVSEASDGDEGLGRAEERDYDLILTDLRMPGLDGVELLRRVRQFSPRTSVIITTAHASVDTAISALHEGVQDYMLKPLVYDELVARVRRLLEQKERNWQLQHLRREVESRYDIDNLVGESAAMHKVAELIKRVAPTGSTVLITGESGVGKEVVARAIHRASERAEHIFLPVNCGSIPENLLESQLFGHVRGAFTGAIASNEGMFQHARRGTIFLDEIGELPLTLQVKLLRCLEEKEVLAVGAKSPEKVDVRILAATNRDLESLCREGLFREDLYYRLNVFDITIPPLRERREDIPAISDFLVKRHNTEMNRHFNGIEHAAMKLLIAAQWKGNVRELDNVIEHAMIMADGDWLKVDDLPPRISGRAAASERPDSDDLKSAMRWYEGMHIADVLQRVDGDKKVASDLLGVSLSSLYRKLEDLDVGSPGKND